ncbi:unnamed protein product [Lactuca virosa]|uniref:Sey1/RHD3-like three-helix bundle domain-containing protein n=1 Tax=Lactuca virosa TaxID=75947 RepID=A0AAU9MKW5_9ASTR|nr:unnamed protein product [Lactuca virosa]
MDTLINLVNKLQKACTSLGDFGEESSLPTIWDALHTIVVVGGQELSLGVLLFYNFIRSKKEKNRQSLLTFHESGSLILSDRLYQIDFICSYISYYLFSKCCELTLIDLPGLTKIVVEGQSNSIVQDIENTVRSYIEKMMSNPESIRMATDSMKYMKVEDFRHAGEQLKSTRPDEMAEIGEKMANATPEELAAMHSRVYAHLTYELNAAQMLKKQEANNRNNNMLPPPWAIAVMFILGFNEFMTLLRNPLWMLVIFVGYLLFKALWVQLDKSGILSLSLKFLPTVTNLLRKLVEEGQKHVATQPQVLGSFQGVVSSSGSSGVTMENGNGTEYTSPTTHVKEQYVPPITHIHLFDHTLDGKSGNASSVYLPSRPGGQPPMTLSSTFLPG